MTFRCCEPNKSRHFRALRRGGVFGNVRAASGRAVGDTAGMAYSLSDGRAVRPACFVNRGFNNDCSLADRPLRRARHPLRRLGDPVCARG